MYEVIVSCNGLPETVARAAIADILEEFSERTWHHAVICWWDNGLLLLKACNDYDQDGEALADEFSDVVCSCTPIQENISIRVVSTLKITNTDV